MSDQAPDRADALAPPDHVLAAFGVAAFSGARLGSLGTAWRYGDVVLKPARDPVTAAWAAGVFESLRVSGIRVPRPVRSLDGRWVVGGWSAERFVSGRPAGRHADALAVSSTLHDSLRAITRPRFVADRGDLIARADRMAWGDARGDELSLPPGVGAELWSRIAAGRTPVRLEDQLIHCDLFGNVLFAGSAPPAVINFNPLFRPAAFAAAVLAVDAVAWGGAPAEFATTASHDAEWSEVLRRAVLFRLAIGVVHPRRTPDSTAGIIAAADALVPVGA